MKKKKSYGKFFYGTFGYGTQYQLWPELLISIFLISTFYYIHGGMVELKTLEKYIIMIIIFAISSKNTKIL